MYYFFLIAHICISNYFNYFIFIIFFHRSFRIKCFLMSPYFASSFLYFFLFTSSVSNASGWEIGATGERDSNILLSSTIGRHSLVVQCENKILYATLYTNEALSEQESITLSSIHPEMIINFDETRTFIHSAQIISIGGTAAVVSTLGTVDLRAIANAKKTVQVLIRFGTTHFFKVSFNATGTAAAVNEFEYLCFHKRS